MWGGHVPPQSTHAHAPQVDQKRLQLGMDRACCSKDLNFVAARAPVASAYTQPNVSNAWPPMHPSLVPRPPSPQPLIAWRRGVKRALKCEVLKVVQPKKSG